MIRGWKVPGSGCFVIGPEIAGGDEQCLPLDREPSQGVIDNLVVEEIVRSGDLIGKRLALGRISHLVQYVDDSSVVVGNTIDNHLREAGCHGDAQLDVCRRLFVRIPSGIAVQIHVLEWNVWYSILLLVHPDGTFDIALQLQDSNRLSLASQGYARRVSGPEVPSSIQSAVAGTPGL